MQKTSNLKQSFLAQAKIRRLIWKSGVENIGETASQNAKHLATREKNHFVKKRSSLKGSSACEKDYIPFREVTYLIPPQNLKFPTAKRGGG